MLPLIVLFLLTALTYASVGFGGGSSYLALMALWNWEPHQMVVMALVCNLIVVGQGSMIFQARGLLTRRTSVPFLMASLPMALVGGLWRIPFGLWHLLLGTSLVLAASILLIPTDSKGKEFTSVSSLRLWSYGIPLGGCLGLLSGIVGIGGGIFLAPLLYFLKIGNGKEIAALASLFILCNSGQTLKAGLPEFTGSHLMMLGAVLVGGQIGSRMGVSVFSFRTIRVVTAVLILVAGVRILSSI